MNIGGYDIGVCSWSLQPKDMSDLVTQIKAAGLSHMQLGLRKIATSDDATKAKELEVLRASGIKLTGGMLGYEDEDYSSIAAIHNTGGFIPDALWPHRKPITQKVAQLGKELGVAHILAHVGFVPARGTAKYQPAVDRIREVADMLGNLGIGLVMETGQEPAAALLEFMHDLKRPNVSINFDPANMILYGAGDPIAAIKTLGKFIRHVHVKDATASPKPGVEWGAEVPFGTGQVGARQFVGALKEVGYTGPLCIEREAGEQRLTDVKFAIDTLRSVL